MVIIMYQAAVLKTTLDALARRKKTGGCRGSILGVDRLPDKRKSGVGTPPTSKPLQLI
jgi:hypothetical protein